MSLPQQLTSFGQFSTFGGNSAPMTGTVDNTNFPGLGVTAVPPGIFGPIPPGTLVPIPYPASEWKGAPGWWETIDQQFLPSANPRVNPFYEEYKKAVEPEIPMAPPTNRRRIKLRD